MNNKFNIQSFIMQRYALLFVVQERGDWFESKPVDVVSCLRFFDDFFIGAEE
jgi:hypothetical protein